MISSTEEQTAMLLSLESLANRPEQTWITASEDLAIRYINPYVFVGIDGNEYEAMGLLPDFGYGKGVLLTSRKNDDIVDYMAPPDEYLLTALNPLYYDIYNRERIINTLSEWRWIGEGAKPVWLLDGANS